MIDEPERRRRRARNRALTIIALLLIAVGRCRGSGPSSSVGRTADDPPVDTQRIDAALAAPAVTPRDGLAAAIAIDVSGSMDDRVTAEDGGRARKIDVARRAARDLVEQFAAYAEQHRDQPVLLGVYEFSRRS